MEARTIGAVVNTVVVTTYAIIAAWRGFHRRRSMLSARSWFGFTFTLLVGIALIGFGLVFSLAVDRHAPWVGPPRSSTRGYWILLVLGGTMSGVLLSFASLRWFGYGDPVKQFPFFGELRRTRATEPSAANPGEPTRMPPSA